MGLDFWPKTTCRKFYSIAKTKGLERIGPHNENIISLIFGSLLGNAHAEKRYNRTRIHFHKSINNMEYLNWIYNQLFFNGYCCMKEVDKFKKNKIVKFNTYSFASFNFFYDLFYDRVTLPIGKKRLKREYMYELEELFTPLAFAIWFMDDGSFFRDERLFLREGLTITPSRGFDYESQIDIMREIIYNRYNIKTKYVYRLYKSKELIMFPVEELQKLNDVIGPYVLPSLKYKLKLPERKHRTVRARRSLFFDENEETGDMGVNG
jgi:ubiquinol-cytochrome c reductase cytochrome b subunit